jgi:ATP-dependent DNA ligase
MLRPSSQPTVFIEPCLPRPAKQPPAGRGWIHEIKHDGFRILAQRADGGVRLLTRKSTNFSNRFTQNRRRPDGTVGALVPDRRRGCRM